MPIRRRKKIKMLIPLASMGDIAFLLIIFFMLVSSFMKNNVEVDPADSPDLEPMDAAQISVIVDKEARIWLQGIEVSAGELGPAVEVLVGERRQDTPVQVTIHKELKKKDYMPVMDGLSSAGVKLVLLGRETGS